jgi:triacylglycerol lipase
MVWHRHQFRFVLSVEIAIVLAACLTAFGFWQGLCGESWDSCLAQGGLKPGSFLLLCLIRPLLFTPLMITAWIGGESFGFVWGTMLTALGSLLSCALIFLPAKFFGRRYVKPFLSSNLPSTYRLLHTQDYKIVFLTRIFPLFPFDLMSLVFGAADFRSRSVFVASFLGALPEIFIFARFTAYPEAGALNHAITTISVFATMSLLPLLVYEVLERKTGSSLWGRMRRAYGELIAELRTNNDIVKTYNYSADRIPVILLYGFFSSRRSLSAIERMLTARGFQVMSFNLGGLFNVFFTRGVVETAHFIQEKIERQVARYGFKKVYIVGHSKGGLVGLWWLTKLGGSRYCDKMITMGTPFQGSWLTYLALITPLGFFWRDVWQMRPGSYFLDELHKVKIPENSRVYCMHSERDRVSTGKSGIFAPNEHPERVIPVPMDHVSHFEFLYRRDVGESIAMILGETSLNAQAEVASGR